jgi:hypothetical protein
MAVEGSSFSVAGQSIALDTFSINGDDSTFIKVAIDSTRPLSHLKESAITLRFTEILR